MEFFLFGAFFGLIILFPLWLYKYLENHRRIQKIQEVHLEKINESLNEIKNRNIEFYDQVLKHLDIHKTRRQ